MSLNMLENNNPVLKTRIISWFSRNSDSQVFTDTQIVLNHIKFLRIQSVCRISC